MGDFSEWQDAALPGRPKGPPLLLKQALTKRTGRNYGPFSFLTSENFGNDGQPRLDRQLLGFALNRVEMRHGANIEGSIGRRGGGADG